jgi:sister chromatid cohesion protein DCC1
MSTQPSSTEIPLTISHPQQNLRLLELPPELLELLSSAQPPRCVTASCRDISLTGRGRLYFKSSTGTPDRHAEPSASTSSTAEHLHLCTPTQSYQVRQVSTSNSVYIVEPSTTAQPVPQDRNDWNATSMASVEPLAQASSSITAIAKVDTMIELVPVSYDVKAMLGRILPVYNASTVLSPDEALSQFLTYSTPLSKNALLAEIVAPDSPAEQAWRALLAFEFQGRCARPAASTALAVWQSVINSAALERVNLAGPVNFSRFFDTEQASLIDRPVGEAILRYLEDGNVGLFSTAHPIRLDRLKVVCWAGLTLLQAEAEKPGSKAHLITADFISQWRDLLPEAWRGDAELDKLPEGRYTMEGEHIIVGGDGAASGAERPQPAASGEAKSTSGKRKWHDKFKAQRKEIKK